MAWFGPVDCGCNCDCATAECGCTEATETIAEGMLVTYRITFNLPLTVYIKGSCDCPDYIAQFNFGTRDYFYDFQWMRKCIDGVVSFESLPGLEIQLVTDSVPGRVFPGCNQPGSSQSATLTILATLFNYGSGLRPRIRFFARNQWDQNSGLFFDIQVCDDSCRWFPFEFVLPGAEPYGLFSDDCNDEFDDLGFAIGSWDV